LPQISQDSQAPPQADSQKKSPGRWTDKPLPFIPGLILAASGGFLETLAFPAPALWYLSFVCLMPLYLAILGQPGPRAFFFGWVFGLSLGLASFSWLYDVMSGYGGLGPVGGSLVLFVLAAYLALYHALWAYLVAPFSMEGRGALWMPLYGAALWVGMEWLKNWGFTGFNWTPLAGALASFPKFLGAADLVGVYGLSLGLVAINAYFLLALRKALRDPKTAAISLFLGAAIFAAISLYGLNSFRRSEEALARAQTRQTAVIQASVEQEFKWDRNFRDEILSRYTILAKQAAQEKPWLIIWPETAAPFVFGEAPYETVWLSYLLQEVGQPMLVGLTAPDPDHNFEGEARTVNRAWLLGPSSLPDFKDPYYDKRHLVPFGEFVPLIDELPFLKSAFLSGVLGAAGRFSPGRKVPPIVFDGVTLGMLICFESTFPHMARERALEGAKVLTVTTNDAWFGLSWAPTQHLNHSVMRAVETRRPLIRAANNGISGLISPSGRILAQSAMNEAKVFVYPLPIIQDEDKALTFFVRKGWILAPAAALLFGLCLFLRLARFGRLGKGLKELLAKKPKAEKEIKQNPLRQPSAKERPRKFMKNGQKNRDPFSGPMRLRV
jgi:apolipoprotein N-acyltransferase